MPFECYYSTGGEGMSDDLSLPGMLDTVPNIEDTGYTGDEGLVEVTELRFSAND